MPAKTSLIAASLILMLFTMPCCATDTELVVGKTRQGYLASDKAQSFALALAAGDFAQIKLEPQGTGIVVVAAYDPAGKKCRGAKIGPGTGRFSFVADGAGLYRVEVAATNRTTEGSYTITLEKIVSLQSRLAPKPDYESPRIKALKASIEHGRQGSVEAFWEEVTKGGAPLIEPLAGDDDNMLVTFLWRGTPDTHNVLVAWFPYAAGADDYYMTQLSGTDVWYKTLKVNKRKRFGYTLAPNVRRPYGPPQGPDDEVFAIIGAAERPDPLNPNRWAVDPQSVDLPQYRGFSYVEMPEAPAQLWLAARPDVPAGAIEKHRFASSSLKNEREIAVYLPPDYSRTAKPYPLLVLFDMGAYPLVPTPTILDNLIAEHRIPPMVALLVGNAPGARNRELPCNPTFADFLTSELLPWARGLYSLTTDPRQTLVGGSSNGGLAAVYAGLRHPETFGNVLSQSASFSCIPNSEKPPDFHTKFEPTWMARQFIARPRMPLRFYMDAGSDEVDVTGNGGLSLLSSRNLRDVLLAKGYEVYFQEFEGGHGYLSWRGTFADGLILLMGNPSPETQQH